MTVVGQRPLFSTPPVVAAVVTVSVTQEHLDRAAATGWHPVSLAVLDAMPGTEDVDMTRDAAYAWRGAEVTLLRFGRDGIAFISACDGHEQVSPVTLQGEVIKP